LVESKLLFGPVTAVTQNVTVPVLYLGEVKLACPVLLLVLVEQPLTAPLKQPVTAADARPWPF